MVTKSTLGKDLLIRESDARLHEEDANRALPFNPESKSDYFKTFWVRFPK